VSRRHRALGIIRALCTDSYHRDTPEFAEHGFHYLCTLKLLHRPGGPTPGFTTVPRSNASDKPVKNFGRADGLWVFRFACPCGLDPQRTETYLAERAVRYFLANPAATRFDLDITACPASLCDLIYDQVPDGYVGRWCGACVDRKAPGNTCADPQEPLRVVERREEDKALCRGGRVAYRHRLCPLLQYFRPYGIACDRDRPVHLQRDARRGGRRRGYADPGGGYVSIHGGAVNWYQLTAGSGGSQGFPSMAVRMASSAVMPWAAAESR
jgi:hypothetical protein